jgi:hypothetical protein
MSKRSRRTDAPAFKAISVLAAIKGTEKQRLFWRFEWIIGQYGRSSN